MRRLPDERPHCGGRAEVAERRCILTGAHGARDSLIRLAIGPAGAGHGRSVLPDVLARAPGRGAWIGVTRAELDRAVASGRLGAALARAFRGEKPDIPADLGARVQEALSRALLQRLGLELRAGKLVLGSERIAAQARRGAIAWLGHAEDASEDGCRKLDQAWRAGMDAPASGLAGIRLPLDRAALSMALGRDNAVHLALVCREAAARVDTALQRLLRFTGGIPAAENASGGHAAAGDAGCEKGHQAGAAGRGPERNM